MNDFSFFIFFKERILPILSVVLVIFAIWYIFTVYLNSSKQIDKYERQKINWDFSDLVRDTMSQKKPLLPAPHQIIVEMWNSTIKIKSVGLNPTRIGFYNLLKKSGAKIKFINLKKKNNEIYGDIIVKSSKLKKINASKDFYVNSTDEYPVLFIIASLTKGLSVFKGIKDLANKESNRISEMQKVLKQIGIKSKATKDELKIFGKGSINTKNKKIFVPNLGDHRICMSTFVLAALTGVETKIKNFETVFTSSPSFLKIMKTLGLKFEIQK